MLNCLQHKTLIALFVIPLAMPCNAEREAIKRYPNQKAEDFTYTSRQKFKNEVYNKDNNIWAVNEKFATIFGMPKEFISQELVGIEAAAFRIEPSGFFLAAGGAMQMHAKWKTAVYLIFISMKIN